MVQAERRAQLAAASMSGAIGRLAVQSPVDDPGLERRLLGLAHGRDADLQNRGKCCSLKR
jgi:hypothetical protein